VHHTFPQHTIRHLHNLQWLFLLHCLVTVAVTLTANVSAEEPPAKLRMGAVSTVYYHNSHADIILSRILQTDMLDGTGREFSLDLVSLYMDQRPANDISRLLAASHRFYCGMGIRDTLTMGTDTLAVDGVLMIAEHGQYPFSSTGNQQLPKRRFWDEILKVFDESGRVVPVFIDKHLADNWEDAEYIYRSARERHIPLMAGSSVSGTWRFPPADVRRGAPLKQIVGVSHGSTDAYGFHGLEAIQSLAEQRHGGESGVIAVQCLTDAAIWEFVDAGGLDNELLAAALDRLPDYEHGQPLDRSTPRDPKLMIVEYADGLKVFMLELNRPGRSGGWTAAWRDGDTPGIQATQFWTQEARPAAHFGLLLDGIEKMMITGKPTWPVERTLLTSGVLDAVLQSRVSGGKRLQTPWLNVKYTSDWRWQEPPPPPACRPWGEQ
jgi:hypothetical protein